MPIPATDTAELIFKALEYGLPAFETARLCYGFSYSFDNPRRVPVNRFAHRRTLADHRHRMLTSPNNDTLYSSAVMDLSAGPIALTVPAFGRRYHSIAFLDAYTNTFAYIGTRATGGDGGNFLVTGPSWQGEAPSGFAVIRAPGNHITAHARILVDGFQDYAEVHRLQDAIHLSGPASPPARSDLIPPIIADAENFVAVVNQVLHSDPPPAADAPILRELEPVGIGANAEPLTARQREWWTNSFPAARDGLIAGSRQIGTTIEGWQYLPQSVGNFGIDYQNRAKIAIRGIAANIPAESIYTFAVTDRAGAPLDARHHYRLRLAAGTPPADGFWSLSIYEMMPDGSMFFGDNEVHRYAIGSLTQGLVRNADDSLDILIQRDRPTDFASNWLPVPAENFALILRAYLPRPALLDGSFRYPGIERLDQAMMRSIRCDAPIQ